MIVYGTIDVANSVIVGVIDHFAVSFTMLITVYVYDACLLPLMLSLMLPHVPFVLSYIILHLAVCVDTFWLVGRSS